MNNVLPPYFDILKPVPPRTANMYNIRKASFHFPKILCELAEHLIEHCLINDNKKEGAISIPPKVFTILFVLYDLRDSIEV